MSNVKFLQIHTLHGYPAVLLNRDDSGLSKRLVYGNKLRTRISSQCLKRHWRDANDENSLAAINGVNAGIRSREIVTRKVIEPLSTQGVAEEIVEVVNEAIQKAVYGDKGHTKTGRQPLLLGKPEIDYLADTAIELASSGDGSVDAVTAAAKEWQKFRKGNMKVLRDASLLPGGIESALFGRMVTSDLDANIDAAIHVAHAFTVHEEEAESDYFTVVDDLQQPGEDAGADHIGESELTTGLFYGYVVVDRGMLLDNLSGDQTIGEEVVRRLIHLIATVSPGAKLGSTAPYEYANWMLVEAGARQPRSLAEAFRTACSSELAHAEGAAINHLESLDEIYGCNEQRRSFSTTGNVMPQSQNLPLQKIASWAGQSLAQGKAL